MADIGGYWDDNIWAREDDMYAAELWSDPELPRKLLYWSGAREWRQLPELAAAWLAELAEAGLPEPEADQEFPPKQSDNRRPTMDLRGCELHPTNVEGHRQVFWLNVDGRRTQRGDKGGYKAIEVLDRPLKTQLAVISLLTALEAGPIDIVRLREGLSGTKPPLEHSLQVHESQYVLSLLRYYRPDFDDLPHEEQLGLIEGACKRVNHFLEASRQIVEFLEYGASGKDLRPAIENANRDVMTAVLRDVEGLSSPQIAERLNLSAEKYQVKGGQRAVDKMIERGRKLLEKAFGKEGWQKRIEAMKLDGEWFRNLDARQKAIYSMLDTNTMTDEEARRYIERFGGRTSTPALDGA